MFKRILLFFIMLCLIASGFTTYYVYSEFTYTRNLPEGETFSFQVESGESLYSVLYRLEQNELIGDPRIYKVYSRFVRSISVKKGVYEIEAGQSGLDILTMLEEGRQELVKVTIPEGLSARQTAEIFEEYGICSSNDFLQSIQDQNILKTLNVNADSAEGYLYPDTYYFQKDFPSEKVLTHMVENYFNTLKEVFPFYTDLSSEKLQEKVILASIIEKEYRIPEEAPLIASVFYNRLNIGMPLQSCATVIYVITEIQGKDHPDRIYFRDLEIQSDFNTYFSSHLPPAPISNPGKTAIEAAFSPSQTDFLYFVVKDANVGSHTFTSTLSDHNSARANYLESFRSK